MTDDNEAGSLVAQANFKLIARWRMTLNFRSAGITGKYHHTQFMWCWGITPRALGKLDKPSTNCTTSPAETGALKTMSSGTGVSCLSSPHSNPPKKGFHFLATETEQNKQNSPAVPLISCAERGPVTR